MLKKPYSIIQLSDIHIGGLIDKHFIKNLVDRVNLLKADIVVITGDLVDTKLDYAKEALNELSHLQSKNGTYFIVGNHEYFHGVKPIINYVSSLGIKVLENENVYIEEISSTKGIDLVLSGHTHGGQIFPFNFLVKLQQPYVKGLYQHNLHTQIYVNKGTGFWGPPMKLGASSEITLLSLS